MVTQLQDVASQVAQGEYSTNRQLRNEEIRRRMSDNWSAPTEQATQPKTIQDATKGTSLADTYSKLLNNYQGIMGSSASGGGTPQENTPNRMSTGNPNPLGIPGWAPSVVGNGLGYSGYGQYAGLGAAATSLLRGDAKGAASTLASTVTNQLGSSKVPGLSGAIGTLTSGLLGNKSNKDIGLDLVNSGLGTLFSMTNPIAGTLYSLARMTGFNPAYGLNNLFGDGMKYTAPGMQGTAGGFWGNNATGNGVSGYDGYSQSPAPVEDRSTTGYGGYTPSNLSLGQGVSLNTSSPSSSGSGSTGYGTGASYSSSGNSSYSPYGGSGY